MSEASLMICRMLASEGGPCRGCRYSEMMETPLRKFSARMRPMDQRDVRERSSSTGDVPTYLRVE